MTRNLIRHIVREVLLEARDEDLEARANFQDLPAAERKKLMSDFSIYKTLTPEQRSDAAHSILDAVGLVPGPGDVADVVNAILYANEGKYVLAALSLICLVPVIGTAFGIAKKAGKAVPAKIIFEHADEIEKIVAKITPELPNGAEVAEAVKKMVDNVSQYGSKTDVYIDPVTGEVVGRIAAIPKAGTWYTNPKWISWFQTLANDSLTPILNRIATQTTAEKFTKRYATSEKERIYREIAEDFSVEEAERLMKDPWFIERFANIDELAQKKFEDFPKIIKSLSNIKLKISTSEDDIYSFVSKDEALQLGSKPLASYIPKTDEIVIFLPSFERFLKDPIKLKNELIATIDHEIWHAIDDRLDLLHMRLDLDKTKLTDEIIARRYVNNVKPSGEGIYHTAWRADDRTGPFRKMMDALKLGKPGNQYLAKSTEVFVRVRALKKFLNKEDVLVDDLKKFVKLNKNEMPNGDVKVMWELMQDLPDSAYKDIEAAIDLL